MDTEELAVRLRKKDEKALKETIKKLTPLVSTIIYNVGKGQLTKEDIEEVCADVFITLWNNAEKIQSDKLKGYVCCIAKTRAINKLKVVISKAVVNIEDYEWEDDFSISEHTETMEVSNILRQMIDEINNPDREILIRYYYYYQNTSKIAEVMQMNPETVKSKLRRTREKLKDKLAERGFGV